MTQPSPVAGFFGGGGKAAKFPTIGTTITGTITAVHPPEPQRDFKTGNPIPDKTQVRIELQTEQHDPDIEYDDGVRTLYVRGWMTGAIGDALRKAGFKEPAIGGQLSVTYTGDGQPPQPGFNGPKLYSATYAPPTTSATTTGFFSGGNAPQNAPIPDAPPPGIDPKAWAAMPPDAKQAIANSLANTPPF